MTLAVRCGRLLEVEAGAELGDRVLHVDDDGRIAGVGGRFRDTNAFSCTSRS